MKKQYENGEALEFSLCFVSKNMKNKKENNCYDKTRNRNGKIAHKKAQKDKHLFNLKPTSTSKSILLKNSPCYAYSVQQPNM